MAQASAPSGGAPAAEPTAEDAAKNDDQPQPGDGKDNGAQPGNPSGSPGSAGKAGNQRTGASGPPAARPADGAGKDAAKRPARRQPTDRLRASGEQALARGIRQLEGLAQARSSGRRPAPEPEARLRQDASDHLDEGIRGTYGYNENTRPILSAIQKSLKDPAQPVDESVVADLLHQLQRLRRELGETDPADAGAAEPVSHVDPAQLPPAYRSSIQRYFEKLSKTR